MYHQNKFNFKLIILFVFFIKTEFLKLYTQYVNNVGNATAMVKEFESKDKTFKKWLKERRADPKVNKQDLYSFLILPVQRIPVSI